MEKIKDIFSSKNEINDFLKSEAVSLSLEIQKELMEASVKQVEEFGFEFDNITGAQKTKMKAIHLQQNGSEVRLLVPLITLVPVSFLTVDNIDITIGLNSDDTVKNASVNKNGKSISGNVDGIAFNMDILVKMRQTDTPEGLKKTIELLSNSLDIYPVHGTLELNSTVFGNGKGTLIATYRNPDGLFEPEIIKIENEENISCSIRDNSKAFELLKPGKYIVSAGKHQREVVVNPE